jgi:hypothetical protein
VTAENGASSDLRKVGDRIEQLLEELQASVPAATFERMEDLLALVTQLYGAGLSHIAKTVGPAVLERLAADDLVASLLVLHELHPDQAIVERTIAPASPPPPPSPEPVEIPVELTKKPAGRT